MSPAAQGRAHATRRGWFVTGTDTEVGKTTIAAAILHTLKHDGCRCVGMKPVASGCARARGHPCCEDVEILRAQSSVTADIRDVSPYAFTRAVAPHLAARQAGVVIELDKIRMHFEQLCTQADWVVVEGIGGWLVPLNEQHTVADLAVVLRLPVLLVVGIRLGCLNHALLTVEAIGRAGLVLAGWVANQIEAEVELVEENVDALKTQISAPLLGIIPHLGPRCSPEAVAAQLAAVRRRP
ncbi:MAG: dethiobiotin synthase [Acidiferrobacterales bacterium]